MWQPQILSRVSELFDKSKTSTYFILFVSKILRPRWTTELHTVTSLLDFRNYAEDTWAQAQTLFSEQLEDPRFDLLCKELKTIVDAPKRRLLVLSFLEQSLQAQRAKSQYSRHDFVAFVLDQELDNYFKISGPLSRFRPLLKSSRESVEQVLAKMNVLTDNTYEDLIAFAHDLGLVNPLNLWPVLALWRSHYYGESEEVFLHAPLPRVFGGPSTQYKDIERQCDFKTIAKRPYKNFSFFNCVVAGSGHLAYKVNGVWKQKELEQAHMVCGMPGLAKKIWLLNPETMKASVYDIGLDKNILEFDLPGTSEVPNWIDCQRDTEGSLVLVWAHLNTITGSIAHENMVALDEDLLATGTGEFLQTIESFPQRRQRSVRLDFRDHGNLVNVHHSVKDSQKEQGRIWTHNYEVIFANTLLMTLETESRPIEAVYGSPFDIVLLSPLSSSQALQHWTLDESNKFKLSNTSTVPRSTYSSVSIYY